jgi:uncharacterized protein
MENMSPPPIVEPNSRIDLIDALRGSALCGILLLHSIEHWDFDRNPEHTPAWLETLNHCVRETGFFLFGGKSYAIFALMFGVSFFLILQRWSQLGVPFKGRFLWRLTVLGIFGYLNGLIYCGDILLVIALLGVPLVWLNRFGTRTLAWISVALVLQLPSLWETGRVLFVPGYSPSQPLHWSIYGHLGYVYTNGSLLDVLTTNLWTGQTSRLMWTYETGRYTQMVGLFIWGLLLGRARVFEEPARCTQLARRAIVWGVIGFSIFFPLKTHLGALGLHYLKVGVIDNLVSSYCNLAQMAVWAGCFVLLYQWTRARAVLRLFAPYGRISLTCYVTQGMIGVPLFYGYGLALYRHLGSFYSVLLGLAIFTVQCAAAHLWLRHFRYGPLEWLWRAATFGSLATPFRRRSPVPAPITPTPVDA